MINKLKMIAALFLVCTFISPVTWAERDGKKGRRDKGESLRMDKNGDGVVDEEEFRGPIEVFDKIDADGDGSIDKDEFKEHRKKMRANHEDGKSGQFAVKFMERHDENGDGSISEDEFPGKDEHFDRLDENGDGSIDADEAPKGPPHHRKRGRRGQRGPDDDHDHEHEHEHEHGDDGDENDGDEAVDS